MTLPPSTIFSAQVVRIMIHSMATRRGSEEAQSHRAPKIKSGRTTVNLPSDVKEWLLVQGLHGGVTGAIVFLVRQMMRLNVEAVDLPQFARPRSDEGIGSRAS